MSIRDWIHIPDDGLGLRDVYVDGLFVSGVTYADTRKGVVRHYDDPPKIHKHGKRLITRTMRGKVDVIPARELEHGVIDITKTGDTVRTYSYCPELHS